jgi:hypothetical protein
MSRFTGNYVLDPEFTARLEATRLKKIYDDLSARYQALSPEKLDPMEAPSEAHLRAGIEFGSYRCSAVRLTLDRSLLSIKTPEGDQAYPVTEFVESAEGSRIVILIDGRYSVTYALKELAEGVLRLENRLHELDGLAWRRVGEGEE